MALPVPAGSHLDPARTRARVLRVAEAAFYANGVAAVGVGEVAKAAGASKLTIYRHFGSKAGLVRQIAEDRSERVHARIRQDLDGVPPGIPRILALFDLLGRWFVEDGFAGCALVNATIDTRGTAESTSAVMASHLDRYRNLISGNLTGHVADDTVRALTRKILILLEGATLIAALTGDPDAAVDARDAAQALIHAGDA